MYDSSAGGSGGRETKRGRSDEQKRRNINSSSQCTITYYRISIILCKWNAEEQRGEKQLSQSFQPESGSESPLSSLHLKVGIQEVDGQPRTNDQLEHKMHAKRREFPKMARQQKQRNVKALNKKLNYPVMFTSCSRQKVTMVRVVHAQGEQVHP